VRYGRGYLLDIEFRLNDTLVWCNDLRGNSARGTRVAIQVGFEDIVDSNTLDTRVTTLSVMANDDNCHVTE
jgi:hypothetical protein